jgi:hypothetical protein
MNLSTGTINTAKKLAHLDEHFTVTYKKYIYSESAGMTVHAAEYQQ